MTRSFTRYTSLGFLTAGLLAAVLALPAGPASAHRDSNDARGPLDLRRAEISQDRARMRLAIKTSKAWSAKSLESRPRFDSRSPEDYLCVSLRQDRRNYRYCLGKPGSKPTRMVGGRVGRSHRLRSPHRVRHLSVRRPGRRSFAATFPFPQAGLRVGRFTWRVVSGWGDPSCRPESEEPPVDPEEPPVDPDDPLPDGPLPLPRSADRRPPCVDAEPNRGRYRGVVRRPRIVGCTRDEHMLSTSGPRRSHRVALTFDDGPSSYTGTVLDILEHKHVDATFFVIGDNIPGRTGLLRRMIREGHEIANHSLHHETNGASAASIRETSARIHSATGFRSCLYRPPGGYRSSGAFSAAWKLGMSNVLWDVDPRDWSQPGSGAIYSRVTSATRAGSIILLHDGGGDRSQTIAALDDIISNLKNRGYRFVTVSKLLRERYRWRP